MYPFTSDIERDNANDISPAVWLFIVMNDADVPHSHTELELAIQWFFHLKAYANIVAPLRENTYFMRLTNNDLDLSNGISYPASMFQLPDELIHQCLVTVLIADDDDEGRRLFQAGMELTNARYAFICDPLNGDSERHELIALSIREALTDAVHV